MIRPVGYMAKPAMQMTLDDLTKVVKKVIIEDREVAWNLFRNGLNGNVTKTFMKQQSITDEFFTAAGKLSEEGKADLMADLKHFGLPKKATIAEYLKALIADAKKMNKS